MNGQNAWKVIQLIRSIKGTNAKKQVLSAYPEIQRYLDWCYNPYKQYYVSAPKNISGTGDRDFGQPEFDLLRSLHNRALSGSHALNCIRKTMNELNYASGELFKCILSKNMHLGVAEKGINEIFPGCIPTHDIMLAQPIDWNKVKYPCLVSPKLDGLRAIFKNGKFYSRKGHELQGLSTLADSIIAYYGGYVGVLDGELMVPGEHFNELSGQIRSFKDTPNAKYHIFDKVDYSIPLVGRMMQLHRWYSSIKGPVPFEIVPHIVRHSRTEIENYYVRMRDEGYEGIMVKDQDAMYENRRSHAWMKLKNTSTVDLKVIGTFEGRGKYDGYVGGLFVDYNGVRVACGSGLSDSQRVHWADYPDDILGRYVEIAYQEVTPDGSLRHPRLVRVRGDK